MANRSELKSDVRVRVRQLDETYWAPGAAKAMSGKLGTISERQDGGQVDGAAVFVRFDEPAATWQLHQSPPMGWHFVPSDLDVVTDTRGYRFILVRENEAIRLEDAGILGRIDVDNVYLTAYGQYPDARRPADLDIGERIKGVVYRLSGEKGTYDVVRVA